MAAILYIDYRISSKNFLSPPTKTGALRQYVVLAIVADDATDKDGHVILFRNDIPIEDEGYLRQRDGFEILTEIDDDLIVLYGLDASGLIGAVFEQSDVAEETAPRLETLMASELD